jgi:hypothetical protein
MKKINLVLNADVLIKFSYLVLVVFVIFYFYGKDIAKKNRRFDSIHNFQKAK